VPGVGQEIKILVDDPVAVVVDSVADLRPRDA